MSHCMSCDSDSVRAVFQQRHLRHTRQRELIYSTLMMVESHPNAEELHTLVKHRDAGVSLATVYNTLDALVECGLCRRIPSHIGGGCRFDADTAEHVHITTADGKIIDVPDDLGAMLLSSINRDTLRDLETRMGVRIAGVGIQVFAV